MGRRQDGSAIYRPRKAPLSAKTINGYLAILGAVLTWTMSQRDGGIVSLTRNGLSS